MKEKGGVLGEAKRSPQPLAVGGLFLDYSHGRSLCIILGSGFIQLGGIVV